MMLRTLCSLTLALALGAPLAGATAPASDTPGLVVLVVVDQLCAEYIERFEPALGSDGLLKMLAEGASFPDAAHTHAVTQTGPGHAAVATGCLPARAGIPANGWLDRQTGQQVYCVGDTSAHTVGSVPEAANRRVSPAHLERPTLGDHLKQHSPDSLVISIGWKDRAALLMGGKSSDGSYWMDERTGTWVTSSALVPDLAAPTARTWTPNSLRGWMTQYNATLPVTKLQNVLWNLSIDEELAEELAGPDRAPGEPNAPWPHLVGKPPPIPDFVRSLLASPYGDRVAFETVEKALQRLPLGLDDQPDLLCLALASLDSVGHGYGPRSQEVLEVVIQLDKRLADLMAQLDEHVGPGQWTLALTSDHGVAPLPEQSGGLRLQPTRLQKTAEDALDEHFGPAADNANWVLGVVRPSLYLNLQALAVHADSDAAPPELVEEAARVAAEALETEMGIAAARTQAQLAAATDPDLVLLRGDAHPTRCGQVLFLLDRYTVMEAASGTNHGTHHDYDRDVPILLFGKGIAPGQHSGEAAPLDLAPTLARLMGLAPMEGVDGRVLAEALAN